jgi:hypothetical protein
VPPAAPHPDATELERRIEALEARNARVELNKAWETSWTRRLVITALTYAIVVVYLVSIGEADPLLKAIVPAVGFLLSTLAARSARTRWERGARSR